MKKEDVDEESEDESIYQKNRRNELVEDDEIDGSEEGFMKGYEEADDDEDEDDEDMEEDDEGEEEEQY